ncbi:MAG: hypothetical protein ACAH82_06850 [Solirubrobacteraceae bacterium]
MVTRRLLLLAAALLVLAALAAGLVGRDDGGSTAATPTSLPAGETVTREIPAAKGSDTRIPVNRGDLLELEVAGDLIDTVLIERMDRVDEIEPTTPARFNLVIDVQAGSYPIRLVDADRRIGSIVVSD